MQVAVFTCTSILNFRLKEWSKCNDVITDAHIMEQEMQFLPNTLYNK